VPGMRSKKNKKLGCYSGLHTQKAQVFEPTNLEELRKVIRLVDEGGYHVTLRGGTHAFDSQSLNDEVVVSMKQFNSISDVRQGKDGESLVTVGPGATWGDVVKKLKPQGLLPLITVTTEHASAGGTLAGDCLSRFSPAYNKEGAHVESFQLMKVDGEVIECKPADPVFMAAIGGLGYLGAVVSITYRVHRVCAPKGRVAVKTKVKYCDSFQGLGEALIPATATAVANCAAGLSDPRKPDKADAIYSSVLVDEKENTSALVFESAFAENESPSRFGRGRLMIHRPKLLIRLLIEWGMRKQRICQFALGRYFRSFSKPKKAGREYVDDVEGFTFFMDGNVRAKHVGKFFRFPMKTIQQTFVVPSDDQPGEGTRDRLVSWLHRAHELFRDRGLTPTLADVLWLPRDHPFLLSASAAGPGFAVSYAFETSDKTTLEHVKKAFRDLSAILWDEFDHGRVYLVKNVHARDDTLAKMYGSNAKAFFELKAQMDPNWTLQNEFLRRVFPEYAEKPSAPDTTVALSRGTDLPPSGETPSREGETAKR
jgi:decaprenylphospho-beta-D-ribofuranose 2-oxidase